MPLSRNWTANEVFLEAFRDVGYDQNSPIIIERFQLVNRAINRVATEFAGILWPSYMEQADLTVSTTGNFGSSGMSFTFATLRLTATMNSSFASTDIGKTVVFRESATVYQGVITTFVSTTVVVLAGNNLPTADIATVDAVIMVGTRITGDSVSISGIDLLRIGGELKFSLASTSTNYIDAVSVHEIRTFRSGAIANANRIVWAIEGDTLLLARGDSLSNYGTLTLHYPRFPTAVTLDADLVDIPDGAPLSLAILHLSAIIARRLKIPVNLGTQMRDQVQNIMRSYGLIISSEEIEKRVSALS